MKGKDLDLPQQIEEALVDENLPSFYFNGFVTSHRNWRHADHPEKAQ